MGKDDASFSVSWIQPKEINQRERSEYVLTSYLPQTPAHILSYLILTTAPDYLHSAYREWSSETLSDLLTVAEVVRDEAEIQSKSPCS